MVLKIIRPPDLEEIARRENISVWEVQEILNVAKKSMEPIIKQISVIEDGVSHSYIVQRQGVGILNTPYGKFWHFSFRINDRWDRYSVIVKAELDENLIPRFHNSGNLIVRPDSGCETGQLFHDLTCECGQQLVKTLEIIAGAGEGLIVSIPGQDGRGKGLPFKLATLWLQDRLNVNTVEAAALLTSDLTIDVRTFSGAVCILKFFEVPASRSISLVTNGNLKLKAFLENGYTLAESTPVVIEATEDTRRHLEAKQEVFGHRNLIASSDNSDEKGD